MAYVGGIMSRLMGTCGVGLAYAFESCEGRPPGRNSRQDWMRWRPQALKSVRNPGGCGWLIAGFVNTHACKEAFDTLNSKYPLVFQSEVRVNRNSRRQFFMAMWDTNNAL